MGRGRKNKRKNKNKNSNNGKKKVGLTKSQNEIAETSQSYSPLSMEELLCNRIELLYKLALEERLVRKLGLRTNEATRAILLNGSVFGEEINILENILKNSLEVAHNNDNLEPIFQDISELARYSMQTLINMIVHHQSKPTKKDAVLFLLQSKFLSVDVSDDESYDEDEEDDDDDEDNGKEKQVTGASGKNIRIDLGKMLKEQKNTTAMHRRTNDTNSSSNNSIPKTTHDPNLIPDYRNVPAFKDWILKVRGKDAKRDIARKLAEEVEKVEIKLKEKKEWAEKTVLDAAKIVSDSGLLLHGIKSEGDLLREKKRIIKEEGESSSYSNKLRVSELEKFLKNLKCEISVRNEVKRDMEYKNRELRSEIAAYELTYSETQKSVVEPKKKEKRMLKKCKDGEKVNEDLKRKIGEEKRKIEELRKRQEELNRKNDAIELKLRQTKEEKEQARALLMQRNRLYELGKENAKNRLAYVRHELDLKFRQSIDEEKRLEHELSQLINNQTNSASSSATKANDEYKYMYQRSKPCMICKESEVNIVFLPCAHQVICSKCKEDAYFILEDRCPCCDSFIEKTIKVFGRD